MDAQLNETSIFRAASSSDVTTMPKKRNRKDNSIDKHIANMDPAYLDSPIYNEEKMQRIYDGIAQNIKIEMDKAGLTLRELEDKSGVHFSHLSRVFNGKCRIGFDALIRIAAAFKMSPTDFFPYDDNKRMTCGQKFDEITRCLDVRSQNYLLENTVSYVKEYNRLKYELKK